MRRTFEKLFPKGFEGRYGGKVTRVEKTADHQPYRGKKLGCASDFLSKEKEAPTETESLGMGIQPKVFPTGYEANYSGKPTSIEQFEAKDRENESIGRNGQCLQEPHRNKGFEKKHFGRTTAYGKSGKTIDPLLLEIPVYSVPEELLDKSKKLYEAKYPDMSMNDLITLVTSHATNRWLIQNTDRFFAEVADWYEQVEDFHKRISSRREYKIIQKEFPSDEFPPFTFGFPSGCRNDINDQDLEDSSEKDLENSSEKDLEVFSHIYREAIVEIYGETFSDQELEDLSEKSLDSFSDHDLEDSSKKDIFRTYSSVVNGHYYTSKTVASLLATVNDRTLTGKESTYLLQQELSTMCQKIFRIYTIITAVCWPEIVSLGYVDSFRDSFRHFYFFQKTFKLVNSELDIQVYYQTKMKAKINLYELHEEFKRSYSLQIPGIKLEDSNMTFGEFIDICLVPIEVHDIVFYKNRSLEFRQKMFVLTLMNIFEVDSSLYKLKTSEIFFPGLQFYDVKRRIEENFGLEAKQPSAKHKKRVLMLFNRHFRQRLWRLVIIKVRAINYFVRHLRQIRAARIVQKNVRTNLMTLSESKSSLRQVQVPEQVGYRERPRKLWGFNLKWKKRTKD